MVTVDCELEKYIQLCALHDKYHLPIHVVQSAKRLYGSCTIHAMHTSALSCADKMASKL